ncbi:hypothetical protein L6164_030631 [Bauhinia variegata]|uniref:Uncharacterized protein n=1 Tax=Bauhinia variegata TaxID=167791 RepID=A0ACB9LCS9_BAUVA|nr:hypothetical protein L6164_030631 [Bauhinia variegata]
MRRKHGHLRRGVSLHGLCCSLLPLWLMNDVSDQSALESHFHQSTTTNSANGGCYLKFCAPNPATAGSAAPKMQLSVKDLVESNCLSCVPSEYVCLKTHEDSMLSETETIPTIDFSQLTSPNPNQRSKASLQLAHACRHWGFFMLTNHGVSETLRDEVIRAAHDFYDLAEEEKRKYAGGQLFDPIKYGTSFNPRVDKNLFWRDYLKIHVHPQFHAPTKPPAFSEILEEYCKKSREVIGKLLKGISKSLGLEESYIHKRLNLESGSQLVVINFYPPCPKPEVTMGLPPHTDYGLLTLLVQNELNGLQVQYNGKWVPVHPLPNCILVNTGDHMEILTNGKYKSVVHRAVVNKKAVRISIGTAHGPPLDTVLSPAPELLSDDNPPAYRAITYRKYVQLQKNHPLDRKSCLDRIRL